MARYLVTGGAGFVGSHLVLALLERGDDVVVVDDLRTGHAAAVLPPARLLRLDIGDSAAMDAVLSDGPWDGVFHFAALSLVGESMQDPMRYLVENAASGMRLIQACVRHKVPRFVLSSTAAVFGEPARVPIEEDAGFAPASPYGEAKLMLERALYWADRGHGLRSAVLRYFNAAGADPAGRLGEDHTPETHLIPLAIDAALGRRPALTVFGKDYPTPDGTCVRDYVHVSDLAVAHLLALDRLDSGSVTYNLGAGAGHSVQSVLSTVSEVLGRAVPVSHGARRPGDPAVLVSSSARIRAETGWTPRRSGLHEVVESALAWRASHARGYEPAGALGEITAA